MPLTTTARAKPRLRDMIAAQGEQLRLQGEQLRSEMRLQGERLSSEMNDKLHHLDDKLHRLDDKLHRVDDKLDHLAHVVRSGMGTVIGHVKEHVMRRSRVLSAPLILTSLDRPEHWLEIATGDIVKIDLVPDERTPHVRIELVNRQGDKKPTVLTTNHTLPGLRVHALDTLCE